MALRERETENGGCREDRGAGRGPPDQESGRRFKSVSEFP